MNKILFLKRTLAVLSAVMSWCFVFSACGVKSTESETETEEICEQNGIVAYIDSLSDGQKGSAVARGISEYAKENGLKFEKVFPEKFTTEYIKDSMIDMILDGYTTVVGTGIEYGDAVSELSEEYVDIDFILIDAFTLSQRDNVVTLMPSLYDVGYIAGCITVAAGHENIGFFAPVGIDKISECADGFIRAVSENALKNGDKSFEISVGYANSLVSGDDSVALVSEMYADGCQSIFAFGAAASADCQTAANGAALYSCYGTKDDFPDAEFVIEFDYETAVKRMLDGSLGEAEDGVMYGRADDSCFKTVFNFENANVVVSTEEIESAAEKIRKDGTPETDICIKEEEYELPPNVTLSFYE